MAHILNTRLVYLGIAFLFPLHLASAATMSDRFAEYPAQTVAALSEPARKIAFLASSTVYEVFAADVDGKNLHAVTKGASIIPLGGLDSIGALAWSPDHKYIAFVSNHDGNEEIYIVDADGQHPRRLTHLPGTQNYHPSWSPDGKQIAFDHTVNHIDNTFVVNLDGSNIHPLGLNQQVISFQWSPDGKQITFASPDPKAPGHPFKVFVEQADGSKAWEPLPTGNYQNDPSWSSDGKSILFVSVANEDKKSVIYRADISGKVPQALTDGRQLDRQPVESPDGKTIAFMSWDDSSQIYTMNADGSNRHLLISVPLGAWSPVWASDGKQITFASATLTFSLYTTDSNGNHLTNLNINNLSTWEKPAWSPDGKQLAVVTRTDSDATLYVIPQDGTQQLTIAKTSSRMAPMWSPDSSQLAFCMQVQSSNTLYVANRDGSHQRQVGPISGACWMSWSPDGQSIAFVALDDYISVVNVKTGSTQRVSTQALTFDSVNPSLSWSPSGDNISFINYTDKMHSSIVMADANGSRSSVLPIGPTDKLIESFTWSSDGKHIAFTERNTTSFSVDIYVMESTGTSILQLTHGPVDNRDPTWLPNSKTVLFLGTRVNEHYTFYTVNGTGGQPMKLIQTDIGDIIDFSMQS